MTAPRATKLVTVANVPDELRRARKYCAALEAVAHLGAISDDPSEVLAVLRTFAEPSGVLKRMRTACARRTACLCQSQSLCQSLIKPYAHLAMRRSGKFSQSITLCLTLSVHRK